MNDEHLLAKLHPGDTLYLKQRNPSQRHPARVLRGLFSDVDLEKGTLALTSRRLGGRVYLTSLNDYYYPPEILLSTRVIAFQEIVCWWIPELVPPDPDLSAIQDPVALLHESVERWNRWRNVFPYLVPDLSGENFEGEDLQAANLSEMNLDNMNLQGTNLTEANLSRSALRIANLVGANLQRADLSEADCTLSDFRQADLSDANCYETLFRQARLQGTNFHCAMLDKAYFVGADLEAALHVEDCTGFDQSF